MDEPSALFLADLAVADAIVQRAVDERLSFRDRPFNEEGPYYLEAVRTCLSCNLDGDSSLGDETFRRAVYEKIIHPGGGNI